MNLARINGAVKRFQQSNYGIRILSNLLPQLRERKTDSIPNLSITELDHSDSKLEVIFILKYDAQF